MDEGAVLFTATGDMPDVNPKVGETNSIQILYEKVGDYFHL
jgi:hypothetical protein